MSEICESLANDDQAAISKSESPLWTGWEVPINEVTDQMAKERGEAFRAREGKRLHDLCAAGQLLIERDWNDSVIEWAYDISTTRVSQCRTLYLYVRDECGLKWPWEPKMAVEKAIDEAVAWRKKLRAEKGERSPGRKPKAERTDNELPVEQPVVAKQVVIPSAVLGPVNAAFNSADEDARKALISALEQLLETWRASLAGGEA